VLKTSIAGSASALEWIGTTIVAIAPVSGTTL
jgi:hypothetical protein